jgi:hypothetical protein
MCGVPNGLSLCRHSGTVVVDRMDRGVGLCPLALNDGT